MTRPYFTRRKPTDTKSWSDATDPDGQKRNRNTEQERLQYLEDVRDELEWVKMGGPHDGPVYVVDVGCGLGWFLSDLPSPWLKTGVEIDESCCESIVQHSAWARSTSMLLPEYHMAICHHAIEHMEDPVWQVQDIWRLLVPGGWLLMSTPDFDSWSARLYGDRYRMLHDPTHISLFTEESMRRLLRDTGFHVQRVEKPFYGTRWEMVMEDMEWNPEAGWSPPAYGNWLSFYCQKPVRADEYRDAARLMMEIEASAS